MKKKLPLLFCLAILFSSFQVKAQNDSLKSIRTYKVGIFAPLYLDSAFNNTDIKNLHYFPKFALPGFDFVQGALMALDTLHLRRGNVNAMVFDIKSQEQSITYLINTQKIDNLDLIIGSVKDADFQQLSNFAKQKNIPFISATYPNDGGITNNPYLVILNSTLRAHCEALFAHVRKEHNTDNILFCRKPGGQEDKVAGYFSSFNQTDSTPIVNMKTANFDGDFALLKDMLDSTRPNVIIGGSLDEVFSSKLISAAYLLRKKYEITIIGMPNWGGFGVLNKKTFLDFPVYYSSPFFNYKLDSYSRMIQSSYQKKFKGKPSDMVYKGFESVYLFTKLFARYPADFLNHLNDYSYKIFSEYYFKPVYLNKVSRFPDYYENKHIFFVKAINGSITRAW